jgi:hypothetical protein
MSRKRFPGGPAAVLAASLAAACGGSGSPTAPPTPAPVQVQAYDGWTGQPVAAAMSPSNPMPGATVTARAGGYLPRIQTAAPQLFLWPDDEAYVRALVYSEFSPGQLLARWTRAFTVRPLPGREKDTATAVAMAGAAAGLALTSTATGEVELVVDPQALNAFSAA